jgi:beta-glucosidase
VLQAGHHALLAHGKCVQAIRANAVRTPSVGLAPCGRQCVPASDMPADVEAARKAAFTVSDTGCFNVTWWLDPMFHGQYPEDGLELFGRDTPAINEGDMATIAQPMDFCGMNLYSGVRVRAGEDGEPETLLPPAGYPRTSQTNWHVLPELLYWAPRFLYERYETPIVITENGHQNLDAPSLDGQVHDPQRIDYMQRYLKELGRVIDDGVPVQGYFYWTLMDNFEWALGYNVRVGLVYTDFQTLERVPKDSYGFYREVIRSNGKHV